MEAATCTVGVCVWDASDESDVWDVQGAHELVPCRRLGRLL